MMNKFFIVGFCVLLFLLIGLLVLLLVSYFSAYEGVKNENYVLRTDLQSCQEALKVYQDYQAFYKEDDPEVDEFKVNEFKNENENKEFGEKGFVVDDPKDDRFEDDDIAWIIKGMIRVLTIFNIF